MEFHQQFASVDMFNNNIHAFKKLVSSGANLLALQNGKDLLDASKFANKVASISVSKKGAAASMPFLKDIPDLNY